MILHIIMTLLLQSPAPVPDEPVKPSRGYDIPIIDLDEDLDRHVVVDREPGQYLGHPSTHLLDDGKTIIIVYPKGHGRGAIVMKRSEDGGRTWGERLETPANWATSVEVPTLYETGMPDGSKRILMFTGLYPIRMAASSDEGSTWSPLAPIGDYGGIVVMSDCIQFDDGRAMCFFHDDGRFIDDSGKATGVFNVYAITSTDGGVAWTEPEVITTHETAHLCEGGLIRSPDGSTIALLLRENSRVLNSFIIYSSDEGRTWSNPVELPGALTGDRHQVIALPEERYFISFRDTTHESPTQGDWVGWVGSWDDIIHGGEGQYRVRLKDNHHRWDCAYPALELLPDGTIVAVTYGHWTEGESPWILSMRFTMEELDAMHSALLESSPSKATP